MRISIDKFTTTTSKTGQTIGITVAIILVILGAIWMYNTTC